MSQQQAPWCAQGQQIPLSMQMPRAPLRQKIKVTQPSPTPLCPLGNCGAGSNTTLHLLMGTLSDEPLWSVP